MSDLTEEADALFSAGCSCAQAVFTPFAENHGIARDQALKLASGFGGGIGRLGEVCGAVTGAIMVIGLSHGAVDPADKQTKECNYQIVRRFAKQFTRRNGSIICRDLLGFDMSTPCGKLRRRKPGAFDRCHGFVKDAVEILEEMPPEGDAR